MLELVYKMQPLDFVYLLVGIILVIFPYNLLSIRTIIIVLVLVCSGYYMVFPLSLALICLKKSMVGS